MANEGAFDRLFRLALGVVLVVFGWGFGGTVGTVMLVLSVILLGTAAIGMCPIYAALGLNTRKPENRPVAE